MVQIGSMPALQRARKDARVDPESIVKRAKAPGSSGSAVRKLIYSEIGSDVPVLASGALPIHIDDVTDPGIELISVHDR